MGHACLQVLEANLGNVYSVGSLPSCLALEGLEPQALNTSHPENLAQVGPGRLRNVIMALQGQKLLSHDMSLQGQKLLSLGPEAELPVRAGQEGLDTEGVEVAIQ